MDNTPNLEIGSPGPSFPGVRVKLEDKFTNVQELSKAEGMPVYVRIRPMLASEVEADYKECIRKVDDQVVRAVVPASSVKYKMSSHTSQDIIQDFTFSAAYGPETGQFEFFEQCMMGTMQNFIEGQNSLVFSYGTTGSGKTFTLQGNPDNPGIIPLSLHLFFASVEDQLLDKVLVKPDKFADVIILNDNEIKKELEIKEQLLSACEQEEWNVRNSTANKTFAMILCEAFSEKFEGEGRQTTLGVEEMIQAQAAGVMKEITKASAEQQLGYCSIWVSFVEIYNEYVYDLLSPFANQRTKLNLGEDKNGDVYVKGLREVSVSNSYEALKLLNYGQKNLRIASTKLNYQSSRSHCIFTIKVIRIPDPNNITHAKVNRLSFCDLAGSERAAKSQTVGLRLKEAGCINTSLLVLGRCLEQLRLKPSLRDKKLIPFRESKLTRLFSGFFTGRGKAVMISNASPSELTFDETLHVLRFSAVAQELIINDSYIATASSTLQSYTNLWANARNNILGESSSSDKSISFEDSMEEVIQAKDELIEKLLDLAESLKNNLEQEKREKAELEIRMRQDICEEYSQYSDDLLENQKRNFEEEKEAIREIYQKRIDSMEKMYEKIINDYKMQLNEESDSSDDSIISADEKETPELKKRTSSGYRKSLNENEINRTTGPSDEDAKGTKEELMKTVDYTLSLETELESLRTKLEVTGLELQNAIKERNDLLEDLNIYKTDNLSIKKDNDSLMKEIAAYEEDIKSLKEDLAILSAGKETISKMLEEKENKLTSHTEEIGTLMKRINDLLKAQEEYSGLNEAKITKLQEEISSLKEKLADAESSATTYCQAVAEMKEEIEVLKKTNMENQENHSEIVQKYQTEAKDTEEVIKTINNLLEKATAMSEEQAHKLNKLETVCSTLKKRVSYLESVKKDLEEKLEFVEKEHELDKNLQQGDSIEMEKTLLKMKEQADEIKSLKYENLSSKEKISSLLKDNSMLENRISDISKELEFEKKKLLSDSAEMENALKKVEEQAKEIDSLKSEILTYKEQVSELHQNNSTLDKNLKNAIKDLEFEKKKLQFDNAEIETAVRKVKEQEEEIHSLKSEVLKHKGQILELHDTNTTLDKKLKNTIEDLELERKKPQSDSGELEKAQLKVKELADKLDVVQTENMAYKEQVSALENVSNTLDEKLKSISKELELERKKLQYDSGELEKAQLKVKELADKLDVVQTENMTYKEQVSSLENVSNTLDEKLKSVSKELGISFDLVEILENCEMKASEKIKSLREELQINTDNHKKESAILYEMADILQKCEAYATSKTKEFHTSSIKKVEQIMDLESRIKTKDRELESLSNDYNTLQKQLKDTEVSSKKLLQSEKQKNLSVIEDLKKKQAAVQKENESLKYNITKLEREINQLKKEMEENKNEVIEKTPERNASKKAKESLSKEKTPEKNVSKKQVEKTSPKESATEKNASRKSKEEENYVKENTPENNASKKSKNNRKKSNKVNNEKPKDIKEEKEPKPMIYEESDENKCNESIKKENQGGRQQLRCMENMVTDSNKNKNTAKNQTLKRKKHVKEEKSCENQTVKRVKFNDMNNTENIKLQNLRVLVLKGSVSRNDNAAPSPRMTRGRKRLVMAKENTPSKASPRTVRS